MEIFERAAQEALSQNKTKVGLKVFIASLSLPITVSSE